MPASGSGRLIAVIAVGGILGAEARHGLNLALPYRGDQFPSSTLLINLTGSLLLGALITLLVRLPAPHPLLRPFLGTGVLGGYTTYSSFAVDVQQLLLAHRPLLALGYLLATVLGCAVAVWLGTVLAGRAAPDRRASRLAGQPLASEGESR